MDKKPDHSLTDTQLFRQEMQDVVPLDTPATTASRAPRTKTRAMRSPSRSLPPDFDLNSRKGENGNIDAEDGSSHRKNGVQKRIVQKLRRGQFPLDRQLDLHQMNVATARSVLYRFIADSRNDRISCIRVIHGKGLRSANGPRLKLVTHQLLRDHPQVLAFNVCKPADGGSGAVDVLLKSG